MNESIMDAAKIARINKLYHKSRRKGSAMKRRLNSSSFVRNIYLQSGII